MSLNRAKPRSILTRRMLILAVTIAVLQAFFLGSVGWMIKETNDHLEKERRVRDVVSTLSRLSNQTQRLTIGVLRAVTSQQAAENPEAFVRQYNLLRIDFMKDINHLRRLLRPYPDTRKELDDLLKSYDTGLEQIAKLRQNLRSDAQEHYFILFKLQESSNASTEQLEKLEDKFRRIEEATSEELQSQWDWFNAALATGFVINIAIAFLLYRFFIQRVPGRLEVVADNTVNLALGKPLAAAVTGDDEIAQLDTALRDLGNTLNDFKSKERTILENAAEFICSMNSKGVFLEVNQASSALWGYTPDELIGRRLSSLIPSEQAKTTLDSIEMLFNDRVPVSFENTVRLKDGNHAELLWSAQPGDDAESVVMIAHDITERNRVLRLIRESEEQFRTIIDNLPVTVLSLNNNLQITAANPTTAKMFQYQPAEILGKDLSFLFTGSTGKGSEDADIVRAAQTQAIELQSIRKDRSSLAVSLSIKRFTKKNKDNFLAVLQDITTRREIELIKRDFISMISHDLRSPLTSLHGTIGMMAAQIQESEETASNEKEKKILLDAETKIGKLVNLINDFLDLEKIESGSFTFETEDVTLLRLIGTAGERLKDTCPDVDRSISYDSADSTISVRIDLERMVMAILSFVSAIVRFSPSNAEVRVTSQKSPGQVSLFLSGDGCNIPDETKQTCLKRYAIVDFGQHETWTVSGLSLALARATIEAHHGTLDIERRDGQDGFSLVLPACLID